MVEVKHDLRMLASQFLSVCYSAFSHVAEDSGVGVVARTL